MHTLTRAAISLLIALALAGCSEKPPRPDPEGVHGYSNATPQNALYERTQQQGETERIGN
jgi:hypothetical protein